MLNVECCMSNVETKKKKKTNLMLKDEIKIFFINFEKPR